MKTLKRFLRYLLLLVILLVGFIVYVNLHYKSSPVPDLSVQYGNELDYTERKWWESTTVYQIYPRSFQDTDDDGIGDLAGIISRLDYLKDLGVETIWISPFFKSPQKDFGYDVSDYYLPDPDYGNPALIDSLISEIHRREMKIVFDLVLNHTSEEHPWFVESRKSRDNPKSDWYVWRDGYAEDPPNNWHNAMGTNGWHYGERRDQWYFSAFLPFQPDLNWRNPEVKEAMFKVVRYWLDKGVDGFRLDIFNFILEDSRFQDNPRSLRILPTPDYTKAMGQFRKFTMKHPDNFILAKELRSILDEYSPSRFLVGEVFGDHLTLKEFLGDQNNGLNLVFLFDISLFKWKADFFREKIKTFEAFYPHPYQPTYVFSNHDRPRSITLLENDKEKAKCLALMQLTLRGVPFIYQGEEFGMGTDSIPNDQALDPFPAVFDWMPAFIRNNIPVIFNRDNCRTPMQWDDSEGAGFTSPGIETWLPIQDNSTLVNAQSNRKNPNSLINFYRSLLKIRESRPELKWGSLRIIEDAGLDQELLVYDRIYKEKVLRIYINISEKEQRVKGVSEVLLSSSKFEFSEQELVLQAHSGLIARMD